MRHVRRSLWSSVTAFVAAYMLVLQALVGTFALGATANASPFLDAFGNPLCITSAEASGPSEDVGGHGSLPECCTGMCGMFAPLTVEDRTPRSLDNPLPAPSQTGFAFDATDFRSAPDHDPGNPRAPPLQA